ncbi:MAG: hypothetical protein ACKOF9_01520 [Burkholderiales bacterium]
MPCLLKQVLACALTFVVASAALATTSSTSSASSATSASLGSSSTSIETSSDSSTSDKKVAAGDYKVMAITADADRAGIMRLRLLAVGTDYKRTEFDLLLPVKVVEETGLAAGMVVAARERAYGLEFSVFGQQQAFFLVLQDEWYRDLHNKPVTL